MRSLFPVAVLASGLALAVACVTTPPPPPLPAPAPPPPPPPELDGARLCRIVADVEDAGARNALGMLRLRFDATAGTDRHAAFGAALSRPKNEDRFRAFRDDEIAHPDSAVGPLGQCLVYSDWKMASQAAAPCALAQKRLAHITGGSALLGYAKATLELRSGNATAASATVQQALAASPSCEALHILKARVTAATGDVAAQRQAWADAESSVADCFTCAVELGKLVEATEGRAAAAAAFERALKVAPDHAETLRRFAATVAGVDDARALSAYLAAVDAGARDFATLLAATRLSAQLATTPEQLDRALGLAQRAVDAGKTDPDARRLLVDLSLRKGDLAGASTAARALLDLLPDDLVAHVALARAALAAEQLVDAVVHFDAAANEIAAGRTATLDAGAVAAVTAEREGLLKRLLVEGPPPKGGVNAVAAATQKHVSKVWRDRLKKKAVTKAGEMTVVVETDASGRVVDVVIKKNTLGDVVLDAAAVAGLHRATINGGAKRYTLDLTLN